MSDRDLNLVINKIKYSGWTTARVTRGIERCPSDFEITMTDRFPGDLGKEMVALVNPGDLFELYLGDVVPDNLVITGYVDRFTPSIDARSHSIYVAGRGKCQDLMDCSAVWPSQQIPNSTVLHTAQILAEKYGISVSAQNAADVGAPILHMNIAFTETSWDVIDKLCRFRALLAYDMPDGNLLLSRVGTETHSSGFQIGKNVQRAAVMYATDQCYSEYQSYLLPMNSWADVGAISPLAVVKDPTINRFRRKNILAEQADGGGGGDASVAEQRAQWEASRRWGRSAQLHLTVDSWCDESGQLWSPNWLVDLELPELGIDKKRKGIFEKKWVISEVTYHMDEHGTTADLVILPQDAFDPNPILLFPINADVANAVVAAGK